MGGSGEQEDGGQWGRQPAEAPQQARQGEQPKRGPPPLPCLVHFAQHIHSSRLVQLLVHFALEEAAKLGQVEVHCCVHTWEAGAGCRRHCRGPNRQRE